MNKLRTILLLLLLFIMNSHVQSTCLTFPNTDSIIEISFEPVFNPGGIKRLPSVILVKGYLSENLLTVNFTSSAPNATIAISDALTGEVEYTEVCNAQSATIDLTMLALTGSGSYKIEVSTASWKRVGEFTY